jgi:hypothetical protein
VASFALLEHMNSAVVMADLGFGAERRRSVRPVRRSRRLPANNIVLETFLPPAGCPSVGVTIAKTTKADILKASRPELGLLRRDGRSSAVPMAMGEAILAGGSI